MGLLDFLKGQDVNDGVAEYQATRDGVLLDVRTQEEYLDGHIEGSINIPLQEIDKISQNVQNKSVAIFVYCRSGARSKKAVDILAKMGYDNVKNIGGIIGYKGAVVK